MTQKDEKKWLKIHLKPQCSTNHIFRDYYEIEHLLAHFDNRSHRKLLKTECRYQMNWNC